MRYVNLTPHPINVMWPDGNERFVVERSGMIARCEVQHAVAATHDGVPWWRPKYGEVYCKRVPGDEVCPFPDPADGVSYIVSGVVLTAMLSVGRTDCVRPDNFIRDTEGRILGCTGFSVV